MQLRTTAALTLTAAFALGLVGCTGSTAPAESAQPEGGATSTEGAATPAEGGAADAPIEGWPAEIPVPDAELLQDATIAGVVTGVFTVSGQADVDAYVEQLKGAGFSEAQGGIEGAYQSPTHIVAVSFSEAAGQSLMSVAIQPL